MTVRLARIQPEPLDIAEHYGAVEDARAGASTLFVGHVRNHDPDADGEVAALEYTAHPDAEAVLATIASECAGECSVAVSHRTGRLGVGEIAVVIAVSAAHRDEAFRVCRELIERIKHDLPVWKRQVDVGGSAAWKGLGG